ncbi:MAG: UTP--glucose-1-phosphate uridylyltransferase GalU [Candidatus Moranbacteria bacterium]|jgi:UTP--glucose-1-phosphate uridylyltransferase|nr:UTP--glucose-1-phosphate uridylyltransferase GalU [Candidatus Moranbacteria bacterium]MDD5652304.1 UTP--glucose-1-phosphate uridylyltransferase GalU [Candidatus Moranbacteria bacterium]MDX9855222.1 UTP--glucose-1-phosphate uridylyltransferase GalU [Candidatus Moranbacteria bacterium]
MRKKILGRDKKIKKAILPVAGFGTRFLPATKAQPKEMLPVVDKPVIQYLVEEAVSAGIEEIIFVTGRGKRAIEDHFDISFELEHTLVEKEKKELLDEVRKISSLAKFSYVRQPKPLGDGHAILCAKQLINPDETVAVLFGDDLVDSKTSAISQLIKVYEKYEDPVIALTEVAKEDVHKFGVVDPLEVGERTYEIKKFVEKPRTEDAPSNLVAIGKYIITPYIFEKLEESVNDKGEIRLANAFVKALKEGKPIYGYEVEGDRYDCGDKFGFLQATIQMGLKHPETKDKLKKYLKSLKF